MPRRSTILAALLLAALPFLGLQCTKNNVTAKPVTLTYWRVFDDQSTFKDIIAAYRASHPNVKIEYRELRYEEYEQELLNAWAEDRGPDIFSVHNTWITKYQPKITPLPASITLPIQYVSGTIKKEVVTENRTTPSITPRDIRAKFVDVVPGDIIRRDEDKKEQVLGLPLAVDTLVMYYNRDILNRSGIATVPDDWQEFLESVAKITKIDEDGNIAVSGAALGTSKNIPRYSDILFALMAQNGAVLADENGFPTFQNVPANSKNKSYSPGIEALKFYTDFANSGKQAYSWNNDMPDALEAFTQGRVAFFFGYAYHLPLIESRGPQLNWGVAAIPQADVVNNKVNYANYWVETVAKKSKNPSEAWDFVQFATKAGTVDTYLKSARKPTALRELIDKQKEDPIIEPFASSLLTARSWYKGKDPGRAELAIGDMIDGTIAAVNSAEKNALVTLVSDAIRKINQTIR